MTRPRHVYDTSRIATIPDTRRIHVRYADDDDDGDDLENPVITQEETNTRARFRQGLSRRLFSFPTILTSRRTRLSFSRDTRPDFSRLHTKKRKGHRRFIVTSWTIFQAFLALLSFVFSFLPFLWNCCLFPARFEVQRLSVTSSRHR